MFCLTNNAVLQQIGLLLLAAVKILCDWNRDILGFPKSFPQQIQSHNLCFNTHIKKWELGGIDYLRARADFDITPLIVSLLKFEPLNVKRCNPATCFRSKL